MSLKGVFKQTTEERLKLITEGDLKKAFIFIALPGILMVMIKSAAPLLDGLIIYRFDDEVGGAAISYANSLNNIINMGIFALGIAGSAIIGNFNGGGDRKKALDYTGQLIGIVILISLIAIPFVLLATYGMTYNFDDLDLKRKVIQYICFTAISIPFLTIQVVYSSVKSVFGKPEIALYRTLLYVPIKLFCSFMYIIVFKLGVIGAGLSTLTSSFIVSLFVVYDMFLKKDEDRLEFKQLIPKKFSSKIILLKAWPLMLQDSLKSLSFFLIRFELAKYGTMALSAGGIASDINMLFSSFLSCFSSAIIAFVSVNIGSNNRERAIESSRFALQLGVSIAIISTIIANIFTPQIVALYTDDVELARAAIQATRLYSSAFIGFAVMFNISPTFNALGQNKITLFIQLIRIWVVRLFVLYLLYFLFEDIGFIAVYISLSIANNVGGILSYIFYKKINWKLVSKNM
ncbi:MAG: MATE family efflux transporter [Lachnospirales bacterium]